MTCPNCNLRPAEPKQTLCHDCREHAERISMKRFAEAVTTGPVSKIKVVK